VTPIPISKELKDVSIGVLTLEALGLTVDPTTSKLKETRILLLRAVKPLHPFEVLSDSKRDELASDHAQIL